MKRLLGVALACVLTILALAACGSHTRQSAMGSVHPHGWGAGTLTVGVSPLTSTPTAVMYDSVDLGQFPAGSFALAGYTAGRWPTWGSILARFPRAHHVSVAISARFHADCLDVEPGDASPGQAGPWAVADIKTGFKRPCLYGSLSEMPAIRSSLARSLGAAWRSRVFLWLAWYRGIPGLVSDYDAVQWTDRALGRNLDESTVSLAFLTVAQPPYLKPRRLPVCYHRREPARACAKARAKVASDHRAAASSERAYLAQGCPILAQRVDWFSTQLRRHPRVRAGKRRRALAASRAAFRQRSCGTFAQRARWFTAAAARIEAAN